MNKCERCNDKSWDVFSSPVTFIGGITYALCVPCRRGVEVAIMTSPELTQLRLAEAEYSRYARGVSTDNCDAIVEALRAGEEALRLLLEHLIPPADQTADDPS